MQPRGRALSLAYLPILLITVVRGYRYSDHQSVVFNRSLTAQPFTVLASTFNAGNRKCDTASSFDHLFHTMFAGHESADVVIAGFQEYRDNCSDHNTSVHEHIKENILWTKDGNTFQLFKNLISTLSEELRQSLVLISDPKGTSEDISQDLVTSLPIKLATLGSALEELFKKEPQAPQSWLGDHLVAMDSFLTTASSGKEQVLTFTEGNLQGKTFHCCCSIVKKWRKNCGVHQDACPPKTVGFKPHDEDIKGSCLVSKNTVPSDVQEALPHPLAGVVDQVQQMAARQQAKEMPGAGESWKNEAVNSATVTAIQLEGLLGDIYKFGKFSDVIADKQYFGSGWLCHKASHYDTGLHVFVNPQSKWKVSFGTSDVDRTSITTAGGCGKVLNFLKMTFTHKEDASKSFATCALNTHFSFAGDTSTRIHAGNMAVDLINKAGCDSAFFMGDFNTRLHCEPDYLAASTETENVCRRTPVNSDCNLPSKAMDKLKKEASKSADDCFEKCKADGNCAASKWCSNKCSSIEVGKLVNTSAGCNVRERESCFEKMVTKFCKSDSGAPTCQLAGENLHYDELSQMLESETVNCYEEKDGDKGGHELVTFENKIFSSFGFKEAGPVSFPPSYKVTLETKPKLLGKAFQYCTGPKYCFSTDNKQKRNFAWTDRVLVKTEAEIKETKYERRDPPVHFNSDHLPVTAIIDLTL